MSAPAGIGLITLDVELRIRSWNQWIASATGLPEDVVKGRPLLDVVPATRVELLRDVLGEVVSSGVTRVLAPALHHYILLCAPSEPAPPFAEMQQSVTVAPLRADGVVVGVMITIEDVTSRLAADHAAAEAKRRGSENHTAAVGADDWQRRSAATAALKRSATREQIAELLASLQRDHHNFSVLSGVLDVLIASRDVTAPLIELLDDENPNLRMHAALALGSIAEPVAVPGLLRALDDADANVRFHAIEALGRIGAAEAVEPLVRVAQSGDFFLAFPAIDALARIDDVSMLPALVRLLDHDLLRPAVIDALAGLGDEECVAPLVTLLNEGEADVTAIASALSRLATRYDETFGAGGQIADLVRTCVAESGVARICSAVKARLKPLPPLVQMAGWIGTPAVDALLSVLDDTDLQPFIIDGVLGIGEAAVPPLMAVLADGHPGARTAAASLLGRLGDSRALPSLIAALASHDVALVTAAADSLGTLGAAGALEPLVELFAHPNVMVRQAAVAAVHSIGGDRTPAHIQQALVSPDARVRECAVRVAGYFGFETCRAGVIRAMEDEAPDVRRAAIEQLPLVDDARGPGLLLRALREDAPRNRAAAAHALRLVDDPAVEDGLIAALDDEDSWVRYFAAGSLQAHRTERTAARLADVVLHDVAPHVRITAVTALSTVAPHALVTIVRSLIEGESEEVAASAVAALGRVQDPAVDELLEQTLHGLSDAMRLAAAAGLTARGSIAAVQALAWAARLAEPRALATVAIDGLRRIAARPDASGRQAAVTALVTLGVDALRRPQIVQLLGSLPADVVAMLEGSIQSPRADVRVVAIDALARMHDPRASQVLAGTLQDVHPAVRAAAVAAFGRLGSPAVRSQLAAMAEQDPDAAVRRRAAAVCRRHGWLRATTQESS
jgi:HEAT repeat protein